MIKPVEINTFARKHLIPLDAFFELTYRCNLLCKHCYISDKINKKEEDVNELSLSEIKGVIDDLEKLGTFSVTLTGGEVFLRKDLFDIFEHLTMKKFSFTVLTNGIEIVKYEKKLKEICSGNNFCNLIRVSLYGITSETHSIITKSSKSFDKSIEGIRLLKHLGINTEISFILSQFNIHELYEMQEFSKKIGVSCGFGKDIIPTFNGNKDFLINRYRLSNEKDVLFINKMVIEDDSNNKLLCDQEKRKQVSAVCGVATSTIKIDPYGNVYPCSAVHESAGNLKMESLRNIWFHSDVLNGFRNNNYTSDKFTKCNICNYKKYCKNRCMGHFKIETGDYFTPPEYFCNEKRIIAESVDLSLEQSNKQK